MVGNGLAALPFLYILIFIYRWHIYYLSLQYLDIAFKQEAHMVRKPKIGDTILTALRLFYHYSSLYCLQIRHKTTI
jgi:hypothetical protein